MNNHHSVSSNECSNNEKIALSSTFLFGKDSVASKINAIEQNSQQQQYQQQHHPQSNKRPQKKEEEEEYKEIEFVWKYGGRRQVSIMGDFDNWLAGKKMVQTPDEGPGVWKVQITVRKNQKKILFKFVVDGVWRCSLDFPTQTDSDGNVNNFLELL